MRSGPPLLLPERQPVGIIARIGFERGINGSSLCCPYVRERERRRSQGVFGSGAGSASGSLQHREMIDDDDEVAVRLTQEPRRPSKAMGLTGGQGTTPRRTRFGYTPPVLRRR
jgi:hypothetical protein